MEWTHEWGTNKNRIGWSKLKQMRAEEKKVETVCNRVNIVQYRRQLRNNANQKINNINEKVERRVIEKMEELSRDWIENKIIRMHAKETRYATIR